MADGFADAAVTGGAFGGAIMGGLALLKLIGGGFSWLLTRTDRREAALVAKLEKRVDELEKRTDQLGNENVALRLAFELVAGVVRRTEPTNAELARAERILNAAFVVHLETPTDMQAQLDKMK